MLAVHVMRFLSVAFGAVTVAMTYLLALELFPGKPLLAFAQFAYFESSRADLSHPAGIPQTPRIFAGEWNDLLF